jgi:hypothetical protein
MGGVLSLGPGVDVRLAGLPYSGVGLISARIWCQYVIFHFCAADRDPVPAIVRRIG